jgi:sec-independent protein translocase protein TatA
LRGLRTAPLPLGAMDFSLWQIAIVLLIALLVFGPKRLPELGRSLGQGMREFRDSITGKDDEERKPELDKAQADDESVDKVATQTKA